MRKVLILLISTIMIIGLVACSNTVSDYPAMIMVDGVLYYVSEDMFTSEINEAAVKKVQSYTDSVPTKDGQCNFDRSLKAKYTATDDGLAVYIDGKWKRCGEKQVRKTTHNAAEVYMYSFTIYTNPANSFIPVGTTDCLYYIGDNSFEIADETSGEILLSVPIAAWDWSQLSKEYWEQLFTLFPPDISGIHKPLVLKLSDQYFLFNMDGGLWLGDYSGDKNGMWSIYELTQYQPQKYPSASDEPGTASSLDAAISKAILEHNHGRYLPGEFACESHALLSVQKEHSESDERGILTAYALALYEEYNYSDGSIQTVSGGYGPVAIEFCFTNESYTVKGYWEPRDGSYYEPDIREKFPDGVDIAALNAQNSILSLTQDCYSQAVEHGDVDADLVVSQLLDSILSSPASSLDPSDYIAEHTLEYRELTFYGDYTLRYIFYEFLHGGQTGLRGLVMMALMNDLIGGEAIKSEVDNGQEYFDLWHAYIERQYTDHNDDARFMETQYPKGMLLLNMLF